MSDTAEDLQKARARLVRLLHLRHLGLDPAIKNFRSNEANTANALEHALGIRFERSLGAGDWQGSDGRIYDDCSPAKSQFFNAQSWAKSLHKHLFQKQGIHVVTVDLRDRGLTTEQLSEVTAGLNALPQSAMGRVVVLLNQDG